jgi:RNA polymerase sigma-70 factor (ECF subfamily)
MYILQKNNPMLFRTKFATEEQLIKGIKKGSRQAEKQLYEKHAQQLFLACLQYLGNRQDAEDVLHDSFIKIFDKMKDFESRFEGSLFVWMRRIVVNSAISKIREQKKVCFQDSPEENIPDLDEEYIEGPEDLITQDMVLDAMNQLPTGYRLVFNLFVLEGKKHSEISELLSISVNTSKSQLSKARRKLTSILNQIQQN